ncbi:MAG TPA: TolC family protein [Polyangia bacterium]|nr:TolC family protein [Polyangia bacterium]
MRCWSRLFAAAAQAAVAAALFAPRMSWARDISFAQARAAAERAAPDIQLAERRVDVSTADVQVAGALANPTLTVSTAHQTARLGTSIGLPLPLFGQRGTAMRAARGDADAAVLDVEVVRREVRWRATVAWVDLWQAQERARLLELAAKDADRLFQIASEKFDAGTGPRLDVIRTKADWARAASEAEAGLHLAGAAAARLAPWIGAPPDETITATGLPSYPDALLAFTAPNLEDRLSDHPTLHRDKALVTAATLHIQNEERLRWPTVTPQFTVNQFDPTLPGPDFIVGLSFDLPVLSLRGGAIARAQAQRALAEMTVTADERRLRAELLDAYRRTEGARVRLRALREQVLPSMKEARDMTEEGYRSGRVDLLRLLDAQRALLDSRLAEAEAAASWSRAVADLENATGSTFTEGGTHAP